MVYDPGGGGSSGSTLNPLIDGYAGTPNPTVKAPVNPLTGAPVGNANSANPQSPGAAERPKPDTSGGGDTTTTGDNRGRDPRNPLINKPLHPLSENRFRVGRENSRVQPHRGTMVRTQDSVVTGQELPASSRYAFRFLYNPETISISTNVYQGVVDPSYQNPNDVLKARFVGQETLSFALMVDRTQEVYEEGVDRTRGTLPDIEALYRVVNGDLGIHAGYLFLSTVQIHWGPGNALHPFEGYVTSLNVQHTKFTPNMTPMRSLVDLSMARLSTTGAGQAGIDAFGNSSS